MKFLVFIALLLSFAVNAEVCLEGRSTKKDATGTVDAGSIEKCYVNAFNVDQGTLAAGSIVILDPTESNGYEIATSTTAGAVPHCMIMESCAQGKDPCKCQTYGYTESLLFDVTNASATVGETAFISENAAGYVQNEALGSIAASDIPVGVFLESKAASGAIKAFLRMR